MDPSDSRLRELGDAVAEAQDGLRRQRGNVTKVRRLFAQTVAEGLAPVRRPLALRARLALAAGAFLALFGVTTAVVTLARRPRPLTFVVGQSSEPGRVGSWLAAPPTGELTVAFSDGTALVLEAGARARVVTALERRGRVLVESGRVRVAARPEGSRWSFEAGPLAIDARGARLDLSWDPIDERFVTTVFDGAVDVQGDCLPGSRPVGPGETLDVSCRREVAAP